MLRTSDYWEGPDAHEIFVHGAISPEFGNGLAHMYFRAHGSGSGI